MERRQRLRRILLDRSGASAPLLRMDFGGRDLAPLQRGDAGEKKREDRMAILAAAGASDHQVHCNAYEHNAAGDEKKPISSRRSHTR